MIASFFFASTGKYKSMVQLFTSTAEVLNQRSNLTPQRAKNTINDSPVVPRVAFDIKQVGFTPSSLFSRDQQAVLGSFTPNGNLFA